MDLFRNNEVTLIPLLSVLESIKKSKPEIHIFFNHYENFTFAWLFFSVTSATRVAFNSTLFTVSFILKINPWVL